MAEFNKNSRPAGDASNLAEKNFKIERLPGSSAKAPEKGAKGTKKKKDKKNKKNKK